MQFLLAGCAAQCEYAKQMSANVKSLPFFLPRCLRNLVQRRRQIGSLSRIAARRICCCPASICGQAFLIRSELRNSSHWQVPAQIGLTALFSDVSTSGAGSQLGIYGTILKFTVVSFSWPQQEEKCFFMIYDGKWYELSLQALKIH